MEKTGGVFLLHEPQSVKLVGSAVSVLGGSGNGWVVLSWFADSETLTLSEGAQTTNGTMSRAIAMSLISLFQVTLAQITHLRAGDSSKQVAGSSSQIEVVTERKLIRFAWAADRNAAAVTESEGQLELKMTEAFASTLVARLVDSIARFSAESRFD